MFTRCPKCKEVHPLTAAVLSRSTGLVQCGRCDRIFNALSFLSDDWHASQTYKPAEKPDGNLPVLGARRKRNIRKVVPVASLDNPGELGEQAKELETTAASTSGPSPETSPADLEPQVDIPTTPAKTGSSQNRLWGLAAALLVLLTVMNIGWTFRGSWLQQPSEKADRSFTSTADIQLVSRDMHTHPTRTGILVLSVTFVNLAQQTQAFPVLRVTLLDAGNQPIAQRRLQPAEYLRAGANINSGLAPDVFLPALLELADPGEQAVGFEIEFL